MSKNHMKASVFIAIFFAVSIALLFALATVLPEDARKLGNLLVWIAVLSIGFFVGEKIVRGALARK